MAEFKGGMRFRSDCQTAKCFVLLDDSATVAGQAVYTVCTCAYTVRLPMPSGTSDFVMGADHTADTNKAQNFGSCHSIAIGGNL